MTSLFTAFVARVNSVPAIDPRIAAHVDVREVVTADEGPAAPTDVAIDEVAPAQQTSDSP